MLGIEVKTARHTWTAALVLLFLGVIYLIRETLFVFTIALMFAYLLYPLLDTIDRLLHSRTRVQALIVTYLVVLSVLAALGIFIGTHVGTEAVQLAAQISKPGFEEKLRNWQILRFPVGEQIYSHYAEILRAVPSLTLKALGAFSNAIYLIVIPILSFFILKDGRQIRDSLLELVDHGRQTAEDTLQDVHTLLLQYMRALLFLCLTTLIVFTVVLSLIGVPYSVLLACIAFPLEFIPLVGPVAAGITIIAVSVFSGGPVTGVVIFLLLFRMFQDYVLSPHLMSKGVELHPLLVIFGVFAGGEIGGVQGIFLSIPVLALFRLLYYRLRKSHVIRASQVRVIT